jgi:hypothetical protein
VPGRAHLAEAVVLAPLAGIDQDGVGLADFLEPLAGLGTIRVAIGMPLQGEPAIGAADLVLRRLRIDPEDPVVVLQA